MLNPAADKKAQKPLVLSRELRQSDEFEQNRIRKSMLKWQEMDAKACALGRGLGKKELVDRVAMEVGASSRQVHSALKAI
jgi:hypothetical protein